MKDNWKIKELFQQLKQDDTAASPSFAGIMNAASNKRQPVPHARPRAFPKRQTIQTPSINALVSQWRSPTDFLLNTPGQRWLNEVPRLGVPHVEINPFDFERKDEMNETEEQ